MVLGVKDAYEGLRYTVSGASYTIYGDYSIFRWDDVGEDFDFGEEVSEEKYVETVRKAIKIAEEDLKSIENFDDTKIYDDDDDD